MKPIVRKPYIRFGRSCSELGAQHPGARGTSVRRRVMPHRKARESKEPSRCSRRAHMGNDAHVHVRKGKRETEELRARGIEKERGRLARMCAMRELKKERILLARMRTSARDERKGILRAPGGGVIGVGDSSVAGGGEGDKPRRSREGGGPQAGPRPPLSIPGATESCIPRSLLRSVLQRARTIQCRSARAHIHDIHTHTHAYTRRYS